MTRGWWVFLTNPCWRILRRGDLVMAFLLPGQLSIAQVLNLEMWTHPCSYYTRDWEQYKI